MHILNTPWDILYICSLASAGAVLGPHEPSEVPRGEDIGVCPKTEVLALAQGGLIKRKEENVVCLRNSGISISPTLHCYCSERCGHRGRLQDDICARRKPGAGSTASQR